MKGGLVAEGGKRIRRRRGRAKGRRRGRVEREEHGRRRRDAPERDEGEWSKDTQSKEQAPCTDNAP